MPDNIIWTLEANLAFYTLRDALTSSTAMRNPDYKQTFVLQTDASNIGMEVVLKKIDQSLIIVENYLIVDKTSQLSKRSALQQF